jgi:hypothetical protein
MSTTATKTAQRTLTHSTAWAAAELGVNERTVRRYIVDGHLGCDVLPGGHYRITEAHIRECRQRALDSKRRFRECAHGFAARDFNPAQAHKPARDLKPARRPRLRRPPLGQEPPPQHFDLSPDALASLRLQYAAYERVAPAALQRSNAHLPSGADARLSTALRQN